MAKKEDIIIAVDPDIERNGLAVLKTAAHRVSVFALPFAECLERILLLVKAANDEGQSVRVIVEAGWLNSANWHFQRTDTRQKCVAIGRSVGMNHECGILLCEMLRYNGIEPMEYKPLEKHWQGIGRKITQGEITQFIPYLPTRTNQEERDAALIAWVYAGLPIKINMNK